MRFHPDLLSCSRQAADLLYTIISRRHESRSLILSTNLPFKPWNTVFPGAACVAALIDCFVQHCHVVDIDGDSWRQKESLALAERSGRPGPDTDDSAASSKPAKKR